MALRPTPIDPIPDETARVARIAFPKGNRYLLMRETVGACFTDAAFADLFATRASRRWRRGAWS